MIVLFHKFVIHFSDFLKLYLYLFFSETCLDLPSLWNSPDVFQYFALQQCCKILKMTVISSLHWWYFYWLPGVRFPWLPGVLFPGLPGVLFPRVPGVLFARLRWAGPSTSHSSRRFRQFKAIIATTSTLTSSDVFSSSQSRFAEDSSVARGQIFIKQH